MLKAVYFAPKSRKLFVLVWLVKFLKAFSKGKLFLFVKKANRACLVENYL